MNKELLARVGKYTLKPAIAVLICLGLVFFFVGKISSISDKMNEKNTANAILQKRVEAVGSLQTDFAMLGDKNYNAVLNAFPTTDNVVEIGAALDKLAAGNGVAMTKSFGSLTPTDIAINEPGATLSTIDISLTLTGTESQFVRFLKALEKFQYFAAVDSISIVGGGPQGWDSASTINLHGKIYLKQISI